MHVDFSSSSRSSNIVRWPFSRENEERGELMFHCWIIASSYTRCFDNVG